MSAPDDSEALDELGTRFQFAGPPFGVNALCTPSASHVRKPSHTAGESVTSNTGTGNAICARSASEYQRIHGSTLGNPCSSSSWRPANDLESASASRFTSLRKLSVRHAERTLMMQRHVCWQATRGNAHLSGLQERHSTACSLGERPF